MPPRGRGRSGSRAGGGRSGSGPSDSKPAALRRIMRERQSSVKGISGSKSKASEGASQSVPRTVSSSSSQPTEVGSDSDSSYDSGINHFLIDSGDSDDNDSQIGGFEPNERRKLIASDSQSGGFDPYEKGKLIANISKWLPCGGIMLLLFEMSSGFILCTFPGAYCYLPDTVDNIWAEFGERHRATLIIFPKGTVYLEDKSSAITDAGVDKQLVDMINKWYHPGMKLCVGKPEYKRIIESVLKIPCMCCEAVMEIMWGLQQCLQQLLPALMPREASKLTKEDRLPMSQGLMKFLRNCGFDIKPEMVNEKIFLTACALFRCDVDDKENLRLLRNAGLSIRRISGIDCEDWDVLKLAIAVKVIHCPEEELTNFHEVLAKDVVSKLKGDARKYKGNPFNIVWFEASDKVVSNHHLRIAKKELLGSLVKEAKKAYRAEQAEVEKAKLDGESESLHNPNYLYPTNLVGKVLRRSPRLNPNM